MRYLYSLVCLLLLGSPLLSMAVTTSDTFPVKALVGADTPPTTPAIQSVTPVTSSQIDVVWTASTDNLGVSGYKLFRDMTQIATTTLTTYSDTGLMASTTYTYAVQAFDTGSNLSSTSASVSTTTLTVIVPPMATTSTSTVSAEGIRSSSGRLTLSQFTVIPDTTSVVVRFDTRVPSRFEFSWGIGDVFEGGYTASDVYRTAHETRVTGLNPGTEYAYQLVGYNQYGQRYVLQTGVFRTLANPDLSPPQNVLQLRAHAIGDDVVLSWMLPRDDDVAYVRVMRSNLFYPQHVHDGYFVFQGSETLIEDQGALRAHTVQYYTVFTVDHSGNVSSGSVVSVYARAAGGDDRVLPPGATVPAAPSLLPTPLPPEVIAVPVSEMAQYGSLQLQDVTIVQDQAVYSLAEPVSLYAERPLVVRVPYAAVPQHLKSIIVTFADTASTTFGQAYLLRIDEEYRYYQAHVSGVDHVEQGVMQVAVYDYERALVSYVRQGFTSRLAPTAPAEDVVLFPDVFISYAPHGLLVLLVCVVLLLVRWFLLWSRSGSDEENHADTSPS